MLTLRRYGGRGVHPHPLGKYLLSLKKHACLGGIGWTPLLKFTDAHFSTLNKPTGGLGTPGHAWAEI